MRLPVSILLLFSCAMCGAGRAQAPVPSPAASTRTAPDLQSTAAASADRLFAQLWVEISPEYRALCRQAFNAALLSVGERVAAAVEVDGQPVGALGKPLAVVADLDETILDNTGYQRELVLSGEEYSRETWTEWVRQVDGPRLTPGAAEFVQGVESLGVTMVYLSNRPDELREFTIETLGRLGLDVSGLGDPGQARLLLRLRDASSDKEPRRRRVLERYEVVAFLGDNIEDFPEVLGHSREGVDRFEQLWGTFWFVLPNPMYGSWTAPFRDRSPREYLQELSRP